MSEKKIKNKIRGKFIIFLIRFVVTYKAININIYILIRLI